jgi:hypothetical protein
VHEQRRASSPTGGSIAARRLEVALVAVCLLSGSCGDIIDLLPDLSDVVLRGQCVGHVHGEDLCEEAWNGHRVLFEWHSAGVDDIAVALGTWSWAAGGQWGHSAARDFWTFFKIL